MKRCPVCDGTYYRLTDWRNGDFLCAGCTKWAQGVCWWAYERGMPWQRAFNLSGWCR